MRVNYHTHTARCHHASGEDREYVECAIQGGIQVLGFSDHCPWIYMDGMESTIRMQPGELDGYVSSLLDLKREYAGDIEILIGLESEYIPEKMEQQDAFLKDYPLDYQILGQHFLGTEQDGIFSSSETTEERILRQYVDLVIEGMESGRYLYAAHPDLLHYIGSKTVYQRHMKRLCQYFLERKIPLEFNMLGLLLDRHYPANWFWETAAEAGNSALIGYDAHDPQQFMCRDAWETCRTYLEQYGLSLAGRLI